MLGGARGPDRPGLSGQRAAWPVRRRAGWLRGRAPAYAGQLGAFRQEQAGHLVDVHPLRHGGGRDLSVTVARGHRGCIGEPGWRRRLAVTLVRLTEALAGRRRVIALALRRWRVISLV